MNKRIVSDEMVYAGQVINVHAVQVRRPDGQLTRRDWVRYPGAVVILPILDDGRIVLIHNERYAIDQRLLELPAGGIDPGEQPPQAAPRELLEETGYSAGRMEKLGSFVTSPGASDEVMHAFVARDLQPGKQQLQDYENIEVTVVSPETLKEMILDGRCHDGKTIATLNLYWLRSENDSKTNNSDEG